MAKTAQLSTPQPLDVRKAASVRLVGAHLVFAANELQLSYEMLDAAGVVVAKRVVRLTGAQAQTYVQNQEQTILTALLNRLGLSATVA